MNINHKAASVVAGNPESGMMDITVKKSGNFFIRTPSWIEHNEALLSVNGNKKTIEWSGLQSSYIKIAVTNGDNIKVLWPVPVFTQTYQPTSIPNKKYTLSINWTGNKVNSISPKGEYLPMF